jgi:hypothetical protein
VKAAKERKDQMKLNVERQAGERGKEEKTSTPGQGMTMSQGGRWRKRKRGE